MTDQYVVPGPPCNLCGEYEAVGSVQNLADYATTRFCSFCGPDLLRSLADAMAGEPEPEAAADENTTQQAPDLTIGATSPAAAEGDQGDDDEPGSARDHWASTTHVRRSTHGHRRPKGAAGDTREGDTA